ncbi:LysR family transcriptional regulator [Carnimonas nigrificans]|uniref:LysR family transcriptional regulator n=1 Tax=Carnimonas nigrificans TaxID=64323 RepID=UPI00046FCD8A|nr:LysR family transcriptional regulator [Carnimonas nigrificans]
MDQLNLLRLFVDIAERGSLSAVARANAISPATVTQSLKTLEERVGATLIVRTTRRLSFTQEGELFLAECRRILTDVTDVLDGVSDKGKVQGELRVTATNDFGRNRLTPLIDLFMKEYPDVRVALQLSDSNMDLVAERQDVALRMGPLKDSTLTARLLMPGKRCVCASPAFWQRHGKPAHPRELVNYNCIVLARPGSPMSHWRFRIDGRDTTVRVSGDRSVNDGSALENWAMAGAGVVLLSSIDIREELENGRLETALDAFSHEDTNLYAVYPGGKQPSRRVAAFILFLVDQLNPMRE